MATRQKIYKVKGSGSMHLGKLEFYSCRDGFSCNSILSLTYGFSRNFVIFKVALVQNICLCHVSMGGFAPQFEDNSRTSKIVVPLIYNKLNFLENC